MVEITILFQKKEVLMKIVEGMVDFFTINLQVSLNEAGKKVTFSCDCKITSGKFVKNHACFQSYPS